MIDNMFFQFHISQIWWEATHGPNKWNIKCQILHYQYISNRCHCSSVSLKAHHLSKNKILWFSGKSTSTFFSGCLKTWYLVFGNLFCSFNVNFLLNLRQVFGAVLIRIRIEILISGGWHKIDRWDTSPHIYPRLMNTGGPIQECSAQ